MGRAYQIDPVEVAELLRLGNENDMMTRARKLLDSQHSVRVGADVVRGVFAAMPADRLKPLRAVVALLLLSADEGCDRHKPGDRQIQKLASQCLGELYEADSHMTWATWAQNFIRNAGTSLVDAA